MSVRKISSALEKNNRQKSSRRAKGPLFRNRVMKGMDNVRGGPRFNLGNRSGTRLMKKHSKKRN